MNHYENIHQNYFNSKVSVIQIEQLSNKLGTVKIK